MVMKDPRCRNEDVVAETGEERRSGESREAIRFQDKREVRSTKKDLTRGRKLMGD